MEGFESKDKKFVFDVVGEGEPLEGLTEGSETVKAKRQEVCFSNRILNRMEWNGVAGIKAGEEITLVKAQDDQGLDKILAAWTQMKGQILEMLSRKKQQDC